MSVADKNIELAKGAANDAAADGGGITLVSGDGNKTFNWVDSTDAWTSSEHIHLIDNKKLFVGGASGTTDGLEIYHDGSNSYIKDSGTGNLIAITNQFAIWDSAANETMLVATENGSVDLYYDNVKKIETTAAGVTVTGSVTDDKGDLRTIPQIAKTATHTLVAADAGKHVSTNSSVTIPPSVFSAGQAITIYNNSGSDIPIYRGTSVTLYQATDGSNANRTLATKGLATILCVGSNEFVITGGGLS